MKWTKPPVKAGRCPVLRRRGPAIARRNIAEPTPLDASRSEFGAIKAPTNAGPEQTIADFKALETPSPRKADWFLADESAQRLRRSPATNMTIELPPPGSGSSSSETIASLELNSVSIVVLPDEATDDATDGGPKTIAFNAEQTIQFAGGSSAIDDSMLHLPLGRSDRGESGRPQRHDQAEGDR